MRLVVFGLTMSSSWGNGHATLWRGLARALSRQGHQLEFFERDVPYYAQHRDRPNPEGAALRLYPSWDEALPAARRALESADVAMVTSYCPDALAATDEVLGSRAPLKVFYDLDAAVTLERLRAGATVEYLGPSGLRDFDLVLSFTGGRTLEGLRDLLGARRAAPLYGSVDPEVHRPAPPRPDFRADFSYMGTWAADRQEALSAMFLEPAQRLPEKAFRIAGAQYPADFPWKKNIWYAQHCAPGDHPAFFCSSPLTLNLTRAAMATWGWCPSGRLFEASACGTATISDTWEGLEQFFEPGHEILVARGAEDVVEALRLPAQELARIAAAARERTLEEHTSERRASQMVELLRSTPA